MISGRWQRHAPQDSLEKLSPGILSRVGEKIGSFVTPIVFESVDPGSRGFPAERNDNGPFGMVGPNTITAIKESANTVGRAAASPFGALVTVTIADGLVRVLTARGNRVRAWAESELPVGVVQDGLIVDEQTFIEVLGAVLNQVTRNGKLSGQKVAVAITGRNLVQRRLTVYVDDEQELAEAIVAASSESMSVRTEEMQIEWNAEALDLIEDEELEYDGPDDEDEAEEPEDREQHVDSPGTHDSLDSRSTPPGAEVGNAIGSPPGSTERLELEDLDLNLEPEPDGEPYDVYALALHKHVIRRNLRTVSDLGSRFAGVQPKILALAAAVNSRAAVVLDIESNTLITAVVSNGLPEVIREVGIDRNMTRGQWVSLVTTQVSRAVAFYDSIFPDDPLATNVEVFVTGQTEQAKDAVDEALDKLPFVRSELPQTLRAPEEFSFDRYAANVGLVILSGKRFWQRAPVPLLPTPKFDYRPAQYRPRPLPVRAVLKVAVMLILGLGVLGSYQAFTEQSDTVARTQRTFGILEQQIELRSMKLDKTREARALLNKAKLRTERLIAANELIQDRDAGFADTMSIITGIAPPEVTLNTVDDDGRVVAVEAEADDYSTLLAYIRLLEDVPQFVHVQVLNLGKVQGNGLEPANESGGAAVVESTIKMSIEITRIQLDDSQLLPDQELAIASNQESDQ